MLTIRRSLVAAATSLALVGGVTAPVAHAQSSSVDQAVSEAQNAVKPAQDWANNAGEKLSADPALAAGLGVAGVVIIVLGVSVVQIFNELAKIGEVPLPYNPHIPDFFGNLKPS